MTIPAGVIDDLRSLTDALDDPAVNIENYVVSLAATIRKSVPSFLGMSLMLVADGYPAAVNIIDHPGDAVQIRTSLRLPLEQIGVVSSGSSMVLYAANLGAFVDLAADVAHALSLTLTAITIDQDLTVQTEQPTLRQLSHINQALGVLIDRGLTRNAARAQLALLAFTTSRSAADVAREIAAVNEAAPTVDPTCHIELE